MKNIKDFLKEALEEFNLKIEDVYKYFNEFNEKYFDNYLKPIEIKIVDNINSNDLGNHISHIDYTKQDVIFDNIIINQAKMHTFDIFRNTLVHEMIHYYVNLKYKPNRILWDMVLTTFSPSDFNDKYKLPQILEMLNLYENQNHKGKWKEMADKLNNKFKELDIVDKIDEFIPDEKYIEDFLKNYKIYYTQKDDDKNSLYVLKKDSLEYGNCENLLKRGVCKLDLYEGDWYELIVSKDIYLFDFFIVKNNFTRTNRWEVKEKTMKYYEKAGCFKKEFIKKVEKEIKESTEKHYKSWDEIPKEVLKQLTEWSKQHPIVG